MTAWNWYPKWFFRKEGQLGRNFEVEHGRTCFSEMHVAKIGISSPNFGFILVVRACDTRADNSYEKKERIQSRVKHN